MPWYIRKVLRECLSQRVVFGPGEGGIYLREWYLGRQTAVSISESGIWAGRRRCLSQRVVFGPGDGGIYLREWYLGREKAAVDGGVHLTRREPEGLDEDDL